MAVTNIEWADYTFNPWIGCTKVDALCAHCYAESEDKRRGWTPEGWGKGKPRKHTSAANWKLPLRWNHIAEIGDFMECADCRWRGDIGAKNVRERCPSCGSKKTMSVRPRVFCASLADWLDAEVPVQWLAELLHLIFQTPHLDWLLLTKRPENFADRICAVLSLIEKAQAHLSDGDGEFSDSWKLADWLTGWLPLQDHPTPPQNVWIGTSVGNQESAEARVPKLFRIPARVHFLSCEPLLGPVNLRSIAVTPSISMDALRPRQWTHTAAIDWVICGGESGPHARPMHPDWARSLRDQCAAAGVPFLFKQWGEWIPIDQAPANLNGSEISASKISPDAQHWHIGKKRAGRLLDGIEHNGFPQLSAAATPQKS